MSAAHEVGGETRINIGGVARHGLWRGTVNREFHFQHGLFGWLQHGVETSQERHAQDHVAVLAADINVSQYVVRDVPDEIAAVMRTARRAVTVLAPIPNRIAANGRPSCPAWQLDRALLESTLQRVRQAPPAERHTLKRELQRGPHVYR